MTDTLAFIEAVNALPGHSISGYEWECEDCHYHFARRFCWVCQRDIDTDGYADRNGEPTEDHTDYGGPGNYVSRKRVLALLGVR